MSIEAEHLSGWTDCEMGWIVTMLSCQAAVGPEPEPELTEMAGSDTCFPLIMSKR